MRWFDSFQRDFSPHTQSESAGACISGAVARGFHPCAMHLGIGSRVCSTPMLLFLPLALPSRPSARQFGDCTFLLRVEPCGSESELPAPGSGLEARSGSIHGGFRRHARLALGAALIGPGAEGAAADGRCGDRARGRWIAAPRRRGWAGSLSL